MNGLAIPPVSRSWERIDNWLAVHAPPSLAFLAPPAADLDLESAQRLMGVEFPAQLVESLLVEPGFHGWCDRGPDVRTVNDEPLLRAPGGITRPEG